MSFKEGFDRFVGKFAAKDNPEKEKARLADTTELLRARIRNLVENSGKLGRPELLEGAEMQRAKADLAELLGKPVETLSPADWQDEESKETNTAGVV